MENAFWLFAGSLITIIVTKLLELYQNSRANKFTLKKIYFEKKISAAEEAITDLYDEITGISKFIRVYEKIAESDIEKFPFIYKEIEMLNKETKGAIEATDKIANRMYLYFDFEEYIDKEKSNLDALLNISTEIRALDFEMEIKVKISKDFENNKEMQEIIFKDIKEKFPSYIPKLKELVELGYKAQIEAKKQLKKIKEEMKKYDL